MFERTALQLFKKVNRFVLSKHFSSKTDGIRNIGILAHIDAGKTTTSERMLFYSGRTRSLGEVHHGNTVTDYLAQERERGITICSSAVTFPWKECKINVLDTPGHIDFTMEVEQSLYAVDGVIIVLDASAGVEAQTVTVWSQADSLPKLIFVNKMDRSDSDYISCLEDIKNKLDAVPLSLYWPIRNEKNVFEGIVDIIELNQLIFDQKSLGQNIKVVPLESELLKTYREKRFELIDILSGLDDHLADFLIKNESFEKIPNSLIYNAIRKTTCNQKIVPVLLGSAYKNIGVQPLMDSVIKYLPAPSERNQTYNCFGDDFVGKVFKIVHDKQKGPLSLVRIFRGSLKKGMRLVTIKGTSEVLQKMYEPLADEYREIMSIGSGDVAVCSGLKTTSTGDLLVSSTSSLKNAQKNLQKSFDKKEADNNLDGAEIDDFMNEVFALQPKIPDAVYFCSIEPPSLAYQSTLENALQQLQREDPSLRVIHDETTGQTVLGGMGELHMDIVKSRILTEYKIEADLGPLQIAYKETLENDTKGSWSVEKEILGSKQSVTMTMSLTKSFKDLFRLDNSPENVTKLNAIRPRTMQNIRKGALAALDRGPRVGGQIIDTQILLHDVVIGRGTADPFIMAAASQCVQKILRESGTRLLEPVMSIQIICPSERVSSILADLSRRRAEINDVMPKGKRNKLLLIKAPLSELSGYSSTLRTITSGTASMTMQPSGYSNMSSHDESIAIRRAQGLE